MTDMNRTQLHILFLSLFRFRILRLRCEGIYIYIIICDANIIIAVCKWPSVYGRQCLQQSQTCYQCVCSLSVHQMKSFEIARISQHFQSYHKHSYQYLFETWFMRTLTIRNHKVMWLCNMHANNCIFSKHSM